MWVGDVCVRMRECGVGSNRSDSPAPSPPAQRRAILLAMARRTARHWQSGAHTAELCDQQRQRRVHLKTRISATLDFPTESTRPGLP